MAYIPSQGDIIWLDFDPSSGREIIKTRPALVLSKKIFNEHTGLAVVAPVTSTVRQIKLEVVLPAELETRGAVLVHQLKSVDYQQRNAEFIEHVPSHILEETLGIARLIIA